MTIEELKKNSLVYITAFNERTIGLSKLCFEALGYQNIVIDNSDAPFYEKMNSFRDYVISNKDKFKIFIRTDADRFVFSGIDQLVLETAKDETVISSEGKFFDGLMQKFRGGTPVIYKSDAAELWSDIRVPDTRKPESDFISLYTNNRKDPSWKCYNILTNLHDYEQYPSKICNVLLNRYYRNHAHLYDPSFQLILEPWKVVNEFLRSGNSISGFEYADFSFMDLSTEKIKESDLEFLLEKYRKIYENALANF